MVANRQSLHVLKDKVGGFQFSHKTYEFPAEAVARVVQHSVADNREPLAGSASKHHIHVPAPDSGPLPDLGTGQPGNGLWQHDALRKIVGVDSAMDRGDLNRRNDIETDR